MHRAAAAVALLLLSACSPAAGSPSAGDPAVEGFVPAPGAGSSTAAPLTVAVAGDVHFAGSSAAALEPGGLDAIAPLLSAADVAVVNVETAITTGGTPAAKRFTFAAPPAALGALRSAGVDVAAMANNHALDRGRDGLADTLAAGASQGVPLVGIGADADAAHAPWTTSVRGHRLAVFDATQVLDSSLAADWTAGPRHGGVASVKSAAGRQRLLSGVRAAAGSGASVVVVLHWGEELAGCPLPAQEELADALVAAGADAVVGSHAHRLLGGGWKEAGGRTGYVDYGLGNFVFYARQGVTTRTGVLLLTLPGDGGAADARWEPARIVSGVPVPLTGAEAARAVEDEEALRGCTDLHGR
ncbi:CapA family protein [Kineococcus sp. T13]|nr:CapA family protein [Kineococcus vitellinus]NAZ74157.1 CapA family protein [Kineococcus vitellinus]